MKLRPILLVGMLFVFLHISAVEKADTIRRHGFITRLLDYFNDANKEKKDKRFDFSIIGGPHYSTDTKLGLGLVAAGLYRSDPTTPCSRPATCRSSAMCRQ